MSTDRELLLRLYREAVDAADPARALAAALDESSTRPSERTWIIALGKAAHPLADAAVRWLHDRGFTPAGGLIVAPEPADPPDPRVASVVGDHPLPGEASQQAAEALESVVRQVLPRDDVWVLISGGTTSLVASPVRGITPAELRGVYEALLGSGLELAQMNRVRKRINRWGGGRLATVLAHAAVRAFVLSDVIGDDVASIGSGPCSPDTSTAVHVRAMLDEAALLDRMPRSLIDLLDRTERGMIPETPKPGDPAFRDIKVSVIGSNRVAVEAAARLARESGLRVRVRRRPIRGDASVAGASIARRIVLDAEAGYEADEDDETGKAPVMCYIAGGETTVTLDEDAGKGGRCQQFALSAARVLTETSARITLLAAGTDGRDGPTDAAGSIVDNGTWARIIEAGRDPASDLGGHNAFPALDAAGALIRTGPTRTNVMDVVMSIAHNG